jgi:hypothetical protein
MQRDSDDVFQQPDEDATLVAWQLLMLSGLGFTLAQAEMIVASRSSWHDAQALVEAGCSQECAALILN